MKRCTFVTYSILTVFVLFSGQVQGQSSSSKVDKRVKILNNQSDIVSLHQSILNGTESNSADSCRSGSAKVILQELEHSRDLIDDLGGIPVDPRPFPATPEGLDEYLKASGVKSFSGQAIATPFVPEAAKTCGLRNLVPAKCRWLGGVALLKIADLLHTKVPGKIRIRNWWRPTCYNRLVDGADGSDHVQGRAIDIDFETPELRGKAQKYMCETYWQDRSVNLQIGLGGVTLHVGFDSPKGRRFWYYPSFKAVPKSGSCWNP